MLSIVIVNYRCWDRLAACLNSIELQKVEGLEIIVVDNYSNDGKIQEFKNNYKEILWIEQDSNAGFAHACNRGAAVAKNHWLLFLNPDTVLLPETLRTLIHRAEAEPDWKLIGIRQLNEWGADTNPHGIFLKWWNVWAPVRSLERIVKGKTFSKQYLSTASVAFPDWISGSFVLIRKSDFQELGGWDERFWMYYEDMDLSKRAADKGWLRVMYNDLSCTHVHGGSSRIDPQTKAITKTEVIVSAIRYLKKYNTPMKFGFAMDMFFLPKLFEVFFTYPFSPLTRAMFKRFLKAKIG